MTNLPNSCENLSSVFESQAYGTAYGLFIATSIKESFYGTIMTESSHQ